MLEIADSGIGMKKGDLLKIFNLFQKSNGNVHLSEHTGVGIGLTLCKKVCEELGGLIHLISKQSVGSKFICYFNIG
jgi:signal transduction histidine kinase